MIWVIHRSKGGTYSFVVISRIQQVYKLGRPLVDAKFRNNSQKKKKNIIDALTWNDSKHPPLVVVVVTL
jgi:hypothetical protein